MTEIPEDIKAEFKSQGYTDEAIEEAYNSLNLEESKDNDNSFVDPRTHSSPSSFATSKNENIVQWQLELDSILERVEHMLRGDKIKFINGSMVWKTSKDPNAQLLNDKGISEILRLLSMYLNRNTILSNYREETINDKMLDIGAEVADLLFLKYEEFGMDTLQKRKNYPIIVREVVDIIHSSYLRALHGGERESLREARQVHQSQQIQGNGMWGGSPMQQERSVLNPMRYLGGRFK